jgi:hypothetical protein
MVGLFTSLIPLVSILNPPFPVQFTRGGIGRDVIVLIDGARVERTFAGKLSFRDDNHSWSSYCADIRSPMVGGQIFAVRAVNTDMLAPNYAMAGHIVARFFNEATTDAQCAGLQLAVWKAIEDGPEGTDFASGHLQVRAEAAVLRYAAYYYQAAGGSGSATLLQAQGAGQGEGGSGPKSSVGAQSQISM